MYILFSICQVFWATFVIFYFVTPLVWNHLFFKIILETRRVKLAVFVNTLNGADGSSSHLVSIPANTSLSEALRKGVIKEAGIVIDVAAMHDRLRALAALPLSPMLRVELSRQLLLSGAQVRFAFSMS